MKKTVSLFLLVLTFSMVNAQDQKPVEVNSTTSILGDTLTVVIDFKVANDWMVYDSLAGEVGPIPLSFVYNDLKDLSLLKLNKPHTKHKYDDIFEVDLWYFTGEASYSVQFLLKDKASFSGMISMEYMSCNLTSGVCLPPIIKDVFITK